jgi:hypothetical protein
MLEPIFIQAGLEVCLAVLFFGVMFVLRKKIDGLTRALWLVVWATRVCAAIQGVSHLPPQSDALHNYLGIQVLSGLSLTLVLARSEIRAIRHRFVTSLALQLGRVLPNG